MMKSSRVICLFLLLMMLGASFNVTAAPAENFKKVVLKNGLTLMYKVMKDQPMVSIYAVVPIGFNYEKAKGISHLTEHLVFRGGSGYKFKDIADATSRKGGYFNGFTSFYNTAFNYVLPKENFEAGFKVFNGCLWGITLDPKDVAMEKQIIVYELNMGYSNKYQYYPVIKYFYPEMFHSKETLAEISLDDLHQFHQDYYQPDKVTYVVAGDIDPQQVMAQLEQVKNQAGYHHVPKVESRELDFPVGDKVEERNLYPYQYQLMMGYNLSGLNAKERMVLKLLSYMYGADYKIDYPENQFNIYNVVTRTVGNHDYFGIYYLERNQPCSEKAVNEQKANMIRYFREFGKIDFKREVKNFARLIELEVNQSQQAAEDAVEYEVQRLTNPDSITEDSLAVLKTLSQKDLLKVVDEYFTKPPTTWILVKTTK